MEKEGEGAVLFVGIILAIALVSLVGSIDYGPTGFAVGSGGVSAGQSCELDECQDELVCVNHFGSKVCKQPVALGENCNTADKETFCAGYNVDCYGSYCRTLITGAQTGEKCGPVSATEWVECAEGICLGQETFWAKKAMYQLAGKCYIPHSIEGK